MCVLFSWFMNGRPEIAFSAIRSTQVTPAMFSEEKITAFNEFLRRVVLTPTRALDFKLPWKHFFRLQMHADMSHASNGNLSLQLEYLNLHTIASNICHILNNSLCQSLQFFRSITREETSTFLNLFKAALSIAPSVGCAREKAIDKCIHWFEAIIS